MKLPISKVKDDLLDEEESGGGIKGLLSNKKLLVPVVVVLVIIIMVIAKKVMGGGGGNSVLNYYDTVSSVFTNEIGTFKYVLDVRTGEKGKLISSSTVDNTTMDELNNLDSVESSEPNDENKSISDQSGKAEQKNEFYDWDKYAEVKGDYWQYPNYKVVIEGVTTSLDPLTTQFTVSLVTNSYNDKFTEIICVDGNYYIDVESMYNWLSHSGDGYLISVGKNLPSGSRWLVIPEENFKVASRYAENGEKEFSEVTGLKTMYQRFLVGLIAVRDSIKGSVGNTGMTSSSDLVKLNLSNDDATKVVSAFKNIVLRGGDFYESVLQSAKAKDLYSDNQLEQARREKDNIVRALADVATYLSVTNPSDLKFNMNGQCRKFLNGKNNQSIEATMTCSFSTDDKDYIFQFSGLRSGDRADIIAPQGSQTNNLLPEYKQVMDMVCDYLNPSSIKTALQLEINPDTISDEIITRFVKLVNESGSTDKFITKSNVHEFIEKYSKADEWTEEADIKNAKLVGDLADALNKIVGGVVVEKEVQAEVEVEKYPTVKFEQNGVAAEITYNQAESDSLLIVLDVDFINKSEEEKTVDLNEFSIRTLLNSVYPANNETLLRNYDNTFDMSKVHHEITIQSHKWEGYKLYFALSDDGGHMDLYFGDKNLGSVVEY